METAFEAHSHMAIGAAIRVHRALGPGLLESAYEACMAHEMTRSGIEFERQVALPVCYEGLELDCAYRMDFVVGGCLVLELKAIQQLLPIHEAQLLTYLRLSRIRAGLLLNFNTRILRDGGIRRMVNDHRASL